MNYIDWHEIIEAITEANVTDGNYLETAINNNNALNIGNAVIGLCEGYMEGKSDEESNAEIVEQANREFNDRERR